jgi:hypothetical protein
MNLSKPFEGNNPHQQMDTQGPVGSSGDSNNNYSIQRPNENYTIPSYDGNYQVNISSTNFELETITSSYTGLMRIYRLLYVADHCSSIRNEALLASLKYLQETHFVSLYKQVRIDWVFFDLYFLNRSLMN